jgi:phosphatidylglycerol:prolipoprotein diacylglycerol transferase
VREAVISFPMFGERFAIDPPYCITIGNFNIYFYGIIIAIGLLLAICYASRNCRRFDMTMDVVYDYLIWAVILAVICARLYYVVFFFRWADIAADPLSVFRIRDGGLAIYGGVIGAIAALLIRSRMRHESVWPPMDIMALGLLIGQLVGRWGNFFNREAYGYETEIFCRMGLTLNGETIYVHPAFLYESLWNLLGFLLLHFHSKKHRRWQGQYFLFYLIWYGFGRAAIEGLRSDSLWLIPDVIRISQLVGLVSAAAALVLYLFDRKLVKAGQPPLFGRPLPSKEPAAEEPDADATPPTTENQNP